MKKYKGKVKWFRDKPGTNPGPNGCGFIFMSTELIEKQDEAFVRDLLTPGKTKSRIDTDEKIAEIFVHVSGVIGSIAKGDDVEFELVPGEGAPKAVNVMRIKA